MKIFKFYLYNYNVIENIVCTNNIVEFQKLLTKIDIRK